MDYHAFEEAIIDYFARLHHDPAVARSRAQTIVRIAKACDEELVSGIVLACDEVIPIVPCIKDPHSTWIEGSKAVEVITRLNRERFLERDR
jgi:hypothetical protein